ncbi:MAG: AMP-binding protein, partial [Tidjanibacter sp.]|nr:AMP-binding protein [Tidjanibacter sp.]
MHTYKTLKEIYDYSIREFADRPSFGMFEREQMTYAELDERVRLVQAMLLSAGLNPGDKVALLSSNMPNWGVSYFAVTTMGMVIVPILPDFSGEELDKVIAHSEAKALIISDKQYTKLSKQTIEAMNIVVRIINLTVLSQRVEEQGSQRTPESDELAAIIYTSGTTSQPKGVMLTHRAICKQIELIYKLFPVVKEDVFLSVLPLAHTYECSIGMIYPFTYGSSVTYLDRPPTASTLMPAFKGVRPTIMLSVPLIIEKVFRSQVYGRFTANPLMNAIYSFRPIQKLLHRIAGKKLYQVFGGRMRFFGIGGAKLDKTTEQFLIDAKFPYAIGYGLTETAPLIAGAIPFKTRLQSTGVAMEELEMRIVDPNEKGEGELQVKTPCIMEGYFKNPEATAAAFTEDGWFRTRDLANITSDGYLYIRGRAGSMIVGASGENIYPEDIESVINNHNLVTESIVVESKGRLIALVNFDKAALEARFHDMKDDINKKWDTIKEEVKNYVNSKVSKHS